MHRGLLIRQVFMVLDVALLAAFAFGAYFLLSRVFDRKDSETSTNAETSEVEAVSFFDLSARDQYVSVVAGGLFGKAGTESTSKPADAPAPENKEVETSLPLKLWGVTALGALDPMSSAIIEDTAKKKSLTYFVGDIVKDQATLLEVRPREVVLMNKAANRTEVLKIDDESKKTSLKTARATPGDKNAEPASPNTVVVSKAEIQEALTANLETLMAIQPTPVTDDSGQITGLTTEGIGALPLADKFGLQDGDELQQINGVKIDSVDKIQEVVQKFGDLNTMRLSIVRNGEKINKTVKME